MVVKVEKMKARGIRFTAKLWGRLKADAAEISSTPSDIARKIIEAYYDKKDNG